jgi:hypothetical protein
MAAWRSNLTAATVACSATLLLAANPSHAAPITASIFVNTYYSQTSNSAPLAASGYFFDIDATISAGDYNSASATYPGAGSPQSLPQLSPTSFGYGSPTYATLAALHGAYPFGNYQITTINTVTNASTTGVINYTADHFATALPYVTNYSTLNGANPTAPLTFTFSSFTPGAGATLGYTFLTLYDETSGNVVASQGFLPPSTTSVTFAANTLASNHAYAFELNYDSRVEGALTNNAFPEQGFDLRTDGTFVTGAVATPEPSSLVLLGGGLLVLTRRARARR